MKEINLTQNKVALVCDCHYDLVKDYKWCYSPTGYAVRRVGGRKASLTYMHRVINGNPEGLQVDHIYEDKLDNRCFHLRAVDKRGNSLNRGIISTNTSGYKGVSWNKAKNKWQVQLVNMGKRVYSAYFLDIKEAAKAYNQAAIKYHGKFARINEGIN